MKQESQPNEWHWEITKQTGWWDWKLTELWAYRNLLLRRDFLVNHQQTLLWNTFR